MKTTAEKRELVKRLRGLATSGCVYERDAALRDAADLIESTLPKQTSPGERFWEELSNAASRRNDMYTAWRHLSETMRGDYDNAAAALGIQPQDIE